MIYDKKYPNFLYTGKHGTDGRTEGRTDHLKEMPMASKNTFATRKTKETEREKKQQQGGRFQMMDESRERFTALAWKDSARLFVLPRLKKKTGKGWEKQWQQSLKRSKRENDAALHHFQCKGV